MQDNNVYHWRSTPPSTRYTSGEEKSTNSITLAHRRERRRTAAPNEFQWSWSTREEEEEEKKGRRNQPSNGDAASSLETSATAFTEVSAAAIPWDSLILDHPSKEATASSTSFPLYDSVRRVNHTNNNNYNNNSTTHSYALQGGTDTLLTSFPSPTVLISPRILKSSRGPSLTDRAPSSPLTVISPTKYQHLFSSPSNNNHNNNNNNDCHHRHSNQNSFDLIKEMTKERWVRDRERSSPSPGVNAMPQYDPAHHPYGHSYNHNHNKEENERTERRRLDYSELPTAQEALVGLVPSQRSPTPVHHATHTNTSATPTDEDNAKATRDGAYRVEKPSLFTDSITMSVKDESAQSSRKETAAVAAIDPLHPFPRASSSLSPSPVVPAGVLLLSSLRPGPEAPKEREKGPRVKSRGATTTTATTAAARKRGILRSPQYLVQTIHSICHLSATQFLCHIASPSLSPSSPSPTSITSPPTQDSLIFYCFYFFQKQYGVFQWKKRVKEFSYLVFYYRTISPLTLIFHHYYVATTTTSTTAAGQEGSIQVPDKDTNNNVHVFTLRSFKQFSYVAKALRVGCLSVPTEMEWRPSRDRQQSVDAAPYSGSLVKLTRQYFPVAKLYEKVDETELELLTTTIATAPSSSDTFQHCKYPLVAVLLQLCTLNYGPSVSVAEAVQMTRRVLAVLQGWVEEERRQSEADEDGSRSAVDPPTPSVLFYPSSLCSEKEEKRGDAVHVDVYALAQAVVEAFLHSSLILPDDNDNEEQHKAKQKRKKRDPYGGRFPSRLSNQEWEVKYASSLHREEVEEEEEEAEEEEYKRSSLPPYDDKDDEEEVQRGGGLATPLQRAHTPPPQPYDLPHDNSNRDVYYYAVEHKKDNEEDEEKEEKEPTPPRHRGPPDDAEDDDVQWAKEWLQRYKQRWKKETSANREVTLGADRRWSFPHVREAADYTTPVENSKVPFTATNPPPLNEKEEEDHHHHHQQQHQQQEGVTETDSMDDPPFTFLRENILTEENFLMDFIPNSKSTPTSQEGVDNK